VWIPRRLATAEADPAIIDVVLAMFVNARCGVARSSPWKPPRPGGPTVRGETAAIIGLLRLANLLPADPKGSVPRTRRALKKCGCCVKHDASPRAYTFAWELEAAWLRTVDRTDPREVAVWSCCSTALGFLLRPKYVLRVEPEEVRLLQPPDTWQLRWQRDDKARTAARPPGAPGLTQVPKDGLPARHPRLSASACRVMNVALRCMQVMRPAEAKGPIFARVERLRNAAATPKGAVRFEWRPPLPGGGRGPPVPAAWWPGTKLSQDQVKRNMVRFLTPL